MNYKRLPICIKKSRDNQIYIEKSQFNKQKRREGIIKLQNNLYISLKMNNNYTKMQEVGQSSSEDPRIQSITKLVEVQVQVPLMEII